MIHFLRARMIYRCLSLIIGGMLLSGCGELAYKRGGNTNDLLVAKANCKNKESKAAAYEKCLADQGWEIQQLSKLSPLESDPVIESSAIPSDRRIENASSATPHPADVKSNDLTVQGGDQQTTSIKKEADLKDVFAVNSWWKLGAGADTLKTDITACVSKLGEAHRPDDPLQHATRGLLLCMKDKGWSALRAK